MVVFWRIFFYVAVIGPAGEAMELTFLPLFEGTRTEGERGVVAKIFMTR